MHGDVPIRMCPWCDELEKQRGACAIALVDGGLSGVLCGVLCAWVVRCYRPLRLALVTRAAGDSCLTTEWTTTRTWCLRVNKQLCRRYVAHLS